MKFKLEVLVVDDHDLIIEGYKTLLQNDPQKDVKITCARDCRQALRLIKDAPRGFDIAIFDWILPEYDKFESGGDLAILTKKIWPLTRIIIVTSHEEAFQLYHIYSLIRPSGFFVKSDFKGEEFLEAIKHIHEGGCYLSKTVKTSIKHVNAKDTFLDNYNRQIILLLSRGIKTKNLPQYLPLSLSAIDKRKAQIKDYLLVRGGNDEDILREARRMGFV